jgi:hypothetical protein
MHGARFGWEGGGRRRAVLSWESGARCLVPAGVEGLVVNLEERKWMSGLGIYFYLGGLRCMELGFNCIFIHHNANIVIAIFGVLLT